MQQETEYVRPPVFELRIEVLTPDDRKLGTKSYVDQRPMPPFLVEHALDHHLDDMKKQMLDALRKEGYLDGR